MKVQHWKGEVSCCDSPPPTKHITEHGAYVQPKADDFPLHAEYLE